MTIDPMLSYRTAQLVATYEELYHIPEAECLTYYHGDLGLHIFKYGTPGDMILAAYEKALAAIELDSNTFQRSDEFIYRGSIIARMWNCALDKDIRLRDVPDSWTGSAVLVHEDAPDCRVPVAYFSKLTGSGREDFAALLDAQVQEVRAGECEMEIVITGAAPEELARFNEAYDDFAEAEEAMGDMTP